MGHLTRPSPGLGPTATTHPWPHRVWWIGYWPTADGVRWWLTHRYLGPNGPAEVAEPIHGAVSADRLAVPLRRLSAALVHPAIDDPADDSGMAAVRRAWRGPLADPVDELSLAVDLGQLLLPRTLVEALTSDGGNDSDIQPTETVVIAAGPTLAQVPFELLVIDQTTGRRLLEVARIRAGLSAAAGVGAITPPRPSGSGVLRVIDPGPSIRAAAQRGGVYAHGVPPPIYHAEGIDERWASRTADRDQLLNPGELLEPVTKEILARALQTLPQRLLFLGHALSGAPDAPASAGLVLADPAEGGPFHPFTAAQWIREPGKWPAPPLVALMSCHSNDTHLFEQMGLVQAAVHAGARLVTSTRWVLPADHTAATGTATTNLALAVDTAHDAPDPISALRRWQLDQLAGWRRDPSPATAPLIWAAPTTYQRGPLGDREPQ